MSDQPKLYGPDGITVTQQTRQTRGHELQVRSSFNLENGQAIIKLKIPGTDHAYGLHPAEARILGMQLICEAEKGMADAIAMRVLLEIGGMSHTEAASLWQNISAGTRADHAMTYERMLAADEQARQEVAVQPTEGEKVQG